MPASDLTLGLDPADFGTTGLTLKMLIGIAHNEPELVLPRGHVHGRRGGPESMQNWRLRAVEKVLQDHGVDLDVSASAPSEPDDGHVFGADAHVIAGIPHSFPNCTWPEMQCVGHAPTKQAYLT